MSLRGPQPMHNGQNISLPVPLGREAQTVRARGSAIYYAYCSKHIVLEEQPIIFPSIEFIPSGSSQDTTSGPLINIAHTVPHSSIVSMHWRCMLSSGLSNLFRRHAAIESQINYRDASSGAQGLSAPYQLRNRANNSSAIFGKPQFSQQVFRYSSTQYLPRCASGSCFIITIG